LRALGRNAERPSAAAEDDLLRCILVGFGDRVARRRAQGSARAVMVGRTGVVLDESSVVRDAEYFVAVEIERGGHAHGSEARIRLASAVRKEWLYEMFPGAIRRSDELVFDAQRLRVVRRRQECFFDLVLDERTTIDVDRQQAGELLASVVRADPRAAVELGSGAERLLERIAFLSRTLPELEWRPAEELVADAAASLCAGRVSLAEVRKLDVDAAIKGLLTYPQRDALQTEAPAGYTLPSGREARIDYGGDGGPAVEARIQELFGLLVTPRLARGRAPLVLRIVGPNYRPVQITDDLESFWRSTYPEVRKQMRGRYPKHNWPEDPFSAQPTSKVGRRQPRS
jgi:ATP-dependent helicase HrpB